MEEEEKKNGVLASLLEKAGGEEEKPDADRVIELKEESHDQPYADDFAEEELTVNSDGNNGFGGCEGDDDSFSLSSDGGGDGGAGGEEGGELPGLDDKSKVSLGVFSGGGGYGGVEDLPPWGEEVNPPKNLPSGDFLSEIAQLKADAKRLNASFGAPK